MEKSRHTPSTLGRLVFSPSTALVLSALFWAGNFIVGRALKGEISPIALNFWRWTVAFGIILPLSLGQIRGHWQLIRSQWKLIATLGLTGIAGFHICVYTALTQTTAINALIILSTSPVVIFLISWVRGQEAMGWRNYTGILISFLGTLVLISSGDLSLILRFEFNPGDIWMGLAVMLLAVYSVLLKHRPDDLPQMALLTSSVAAGTLFMIPGYLHTLCQGQGMSLTLGNLAAILYISIFASVLAFYFWNRGVARIGPVKAGMYIHLMPLFGALLSICFLGEGLALFHLGGALFIGAGIVMTNWRNG